MIIETTIELGEALFEHLLILEIKDFEIFLEKHDLLNLETRVYYKIPELDPFVEVKISQLIDGYNEMVPKQKSNFLETLPDDLQDFWTPVAGFDISVNKDSDKIVLMKDFGFGIGLHPSTILILQEMKNELVGVDAIVDIGSGSGILSLYAASKGIMKIYAMEVDLKAIETMKENFVFNKFDAELIFNSETTPDDALYLANMRPHELMKCEEILEKGQKIIISGLMKEDNLSENLNGFIQNKNLKKKSGLGDWISLS